MGKIISVRVGKEQEKLLSRFAESEGLSISDFVRDTVFERIENELDIQVLEERKQSAKENNYSGSSLDDLIKDLDL